MHPLGENAFNFETHTKRAGVELAEYRKRRHDAKEATCAVVHMKNEKGRHVIVNADPKDAGHQHYVTQGFKKV